MSFYPDVPPSYEESMAQQPQQPQQQQPQPSAPPPLPSVSTEELEDLRSWFAAVDEDGNGHITADELRQALLDENYQPFSTVTCTMLVRMFDDNSNGEIEMDEFVQLYRYVRKWRGIFLHYDEDDSGTIELDELHEALNKLYLPQAFSKELCERLMRKFAARGQGKSLSLDNFIAANAAISRWIDEHRAAGSGGQLEAFLKRQLHRS